MEESLKNLRFQKVITVVGVLLFVVKVFAWYLTGSVAILTDALESTINITSAFVGLYSLSLSARPRDESHPYGHGKVEFVSAGIEGTLVTGAGLLILYEAFRQLTGPPRELMALDFGIVLVLVTAVINFAMGSVAVRQGRLSKSLALVASGRHLQSDTYSTIGIVAGLLLLKVTGMVWLDSAVALLFGGLIVVSGGGIVRSALRGIMDEADSGLLQEIIALLERHRSANWIDLHHLRVIKFGARLHLDCHLTVPWYFDIRQANAEIEQLQQLVNGHFGTTVDVQVRADACQEFSCMLCRRDACCVRVAPFRESLPWMAGNVLGEGNHRMAGRS